MEIVEIHARYVFEAEAKLAKRAAKYGRAIAWFGKVGDRVVADLVEMEKAA